MLKKMSNNFRKFAVERSYDFYGLIRQSYNPSFDMKWLLLKARRIIKAKEKHKLVGEKTPIDFVVTWVDENDPKWIAEKKRFENQQSNFQLQYNDVERYRNWENFRYWFRCVEKNAPWVRRIYLVTCGHVPEWLNLDSPKLRVVRHEDFIPAEYLPTFNSTVIEMNLWRIKELGEHFVYFNDDMYLGHPVQKSDFFRRGLPRLYACLKPSYLADDLTDFHHHLINNIGLINPIVDLRGVMRDHPEKWFPYRQEYITRINSLAYEMGYIPGMGYLHACYSLRKSAMGFCAQQFEEQIHKACLNRFRTSGDYNLYLYQLWEMVHNTFDPIWDIDRFRYFTNLRINNFEALKKEMTNSSVRVICINDHQSIGKEFEDLKKLLLEWFEKLYPEKSSFEK